MKAEFTEDPNKDFITIVPETADQGWYLGKWNNCVISAKREPPTTNPNDHGTLTLCREK